MCACTLAVWDCGERQRAPLSTITVVMEPTRSHVAQIIGARHEAMVHPCQGTMCRGSLPRESRCTCSTVSAVARRTNSSVFTARCGVRRQPGAGGVGSAPFSSGPGMLHLPSARLTPYAAAPPPQHRRMGAVPEVPLCRARGGHPPGSVRCWQRESPRQGGRASAWQWFRCLLRRGPAPGPPSPTREPVHGGAHSCRCCNCADAGRQMLQNPLVCDLEQVDVAQP